MAFTYAGDLTGAAPVTRNFQISADVYEGQLLRWDSGTGGTGGTVEPMAAAAAGPDTTCVVAGICTGIVDLDQDGYNSTYRGNLGDYDTSQADQVANNPKGAVEAQVTLITPTTLIKAPIVKDTIGTNAERKACTTGSADGLTFVTAAIDTTVDDFSTAYCSAGANRGLSRIVTTGDTATQTFTIAFPYDIAVGDTFCVVNVVPGLAHIDLDTQFQGVDSSPALTNYYVVYVHELNLEEAGNEYAIFTMSTRHLL